MGQDSNRPDVQAHAQLDSSTQSLSAQSKRFDVALSFPGEHREFVLAVAEVLASTLSQARVFYDEWYEVDLLGTGGDLKLQSMYKDATMVVPFFSEYYSKPWCDMEWETIRGILLLRRKDDAVVPVHLDETEVPGWSPVNFGIKLRGRSPQEIAELLLLALTKRKGVTSTPIVPTVDQTPASAPRVYFSPQWPNTDPEVFGREKELALLDQAWDEGKLNIVTLVAAGGVGKTALVNRWAIYHMTPDGWRGAERVFAWSFYSQGSTEGRYSSSDIFLAAALRWFCDEECAGSTLDPYSKGQRLADLVREKQTLLLLDGAEPLQEPPGAAAQRPGQIQDMGLKGLLKGLAFTNPGLCVISTRMEVADLMSHSGVGGTVLSVDLDDLAPESGMAYLKSMGVRGPDSEILQASKDFGNNALALTLLGHCIARYHRGDVRRRKEIQDLFRPKGKGRHARGVMAWYAKIFEDKPECELLHMIGLFDRPIEFDAISALLAGQSLSGITSRLQQLSQCEWLELLDDLRELRLLAYSNKTYSGDSHRDAVITHSTLDCHPLVRHFFGARVRSSAFESWREAHALLYTYYSDLPATTHPDTIEEMSPLFHAIFHGCNAGSCQEVFAEVYYSRIHRGGERNYCGSALGAYGADTTALRNFFELPWSRPNSNLKASSQAYVLAIAGFNLRSLGRTVDAIEPTLLAIRRDVVRKDWSNAARQLGNMSELVLSLGEISLALGYAEESMRYANSSGDTDFLVMASRCWYAHALHQSGRIHEAELHFCEAESWQKKCNPRAKQLVSVQGYWYCELLLTSGATFGAQERGEFSLEKSKRSYGLLSNGLALLGLGKAGIALFIDSEVEDLVSSESYLNEAISTLRIAATCDHLPDGLLARSRLHRTKNSFAAALRDIDEAWEISNRGTMRLHVCDIHLECASVFMAMVAADEVLEPSVLWPDSPFRLYLDAPSVVDSGNGLSPELRAARAHLAEAGRLITETGYHRRDPEWLLETARLEFLEGQVDFARETLARAKARVDEMGAHGLDFNVRTLEEKIG